MSSSRICRTENRSLDGWMERPWTLSDSRPQRWAGGALRPRAWCGNVSEQLRSTTLRNTFPFVWLRVSDLQAPPDTVHIQVQVWDVTWTPASALKWIWTGSLRLIGSHSFFTGKQISCWYVVFPEPRRSCLAGRGERSLWWFPPRSSERLWPPSGHVAWLIEQLIRES